MTISVKSHIPVGLGYADLRITKATDYEKNPWCAGYYFPEGGSLTASNGSDMEVCGAKSPDEALERLVEKFPEARLSVSEG